jgi:hypothetical protein
MRIEEEREWNGMFAGPEQSRAVPCMAAGLPPALCAGAAIQDSGAAAYLMKPRWSSIGLVPEARTWTRGNARILNAQSSQSGLVQI